VPGYTNERSGTDFRRAFLQINDISYQHLRMICKWITEDPKKVSDRLHSTHDNGQNVGLVEQYCAITTGTTAPSARCTNLVNTSSVDKAEQAALQWLDGVVLCCSLSLCLSGRRFVGWLADWLTLGDTTPGSDQVGGFGIRA